MEERKKERKEVMERNMGERVLCSGNKGSFNA